jgi:hypothetical protein
MFGSRPPQKDRRGRFWNWLNPDLGKSINGWLAGPLVGVETHWKGTTQPCRRYITGGRMRCYCSLDHSGTEWKGYVPIWDENGVQSFAIIGERYFELANTITLFAPVSVTRLRSAGAPVCVKQSAWTENGPPITDGRLKAKDLRPWLLKLWGDKDLIEWLEAHPEVMAEAKPVTLDPERFSPMLKAAARRAEAGNDLPATIEETLRGVPSRNGKGKH